MTTRRRGGSSRRRFLTAAGGLTIPAWAAPGPAGRTAEVVFVNGEVHTAGMSNPRTSAVAVANGRILATGSTRRIERLIGPQTRRVDLAGRTLLPGINDSHIHLLGWGLSQPPFSLDLTYPKVRSIADCAAAVKQACRSAKPGDWIVGRGWDTPYLSEGRPPAAADLDAVCPDLPVVLTEFSGHAVWANSKAMALAGIDRNTVPPAGGVIVRDERGEPTGLLYEGAAWIVRESIPPTPPEQQTAALRAAMTRLLERGVTSATEPGLDAPELNLLSALSREAGNKVRMTGLIRAGTSAAELRDALDALPDLTPADPAWMQVAGVKIMGDGIPTANETAWLHEPYVSGGNGSLLIDGDTDADRVAELREMIHLIHAAGYQIGTHVTGDRSIDTVVDAYVREQRAAPRVNARHYLIHADLVSPDTLSQMAAMRIGANFNPEIKFLLADSQVQSIGPARAAYEWPFRTALETGVVVASSSDAPVTEGNWLQGIATCVERRGKQSGKVSGPDQRIDLDQAIRTYTIAGAWQDHAEAFKGSLEPGKAADLCVLDERLSETPPSDYAAASVIMTMVDGRVAHDAGKLT